MLILLLALDKKIIYKDLTFCTKVQDLNNLLLMTVLDAEIHFWLKDVRSMLFSPHECSTRLRCPFLPHVLSECFICICLQGNILKSKAY